jgi:hypothetical protein
VNFDSSFLKSENIPAEGDKERGEISRDQQLFIAGHWWLTPVILATQEGEIRRNMLEVSPSK